MNLLPKSHQEFSQKEYWDSFFKKRGGKAFEWYGEYPELSNHLHKYIKPPDDILITGCGNSTLGRDLYDIGYKKITNVDISQVVIKQMVARHAREAPELKYVQMDVFDMSFDVESFNVILDKSTLDALISDDSTETATKIRKYFDEIQRVLKLMGRYMCFSLLQQHVLKLILDYFPSNNWMFRVVRCFEAENKAVENGERSMPVFLVVCTKFKALPAKILEVNLGSGDKMLRFDTTDEVISQVLSAQQVAFVCSSLKRTSIEQSEVSLDLYKPGESKPRFTVHIVDLKHNIKNVNYAAFIVPQGRETEWLFSTKAGRQHLATEAKVDRLAIVTLHRGQTFGSFEQLQAELNDAIRSLAPAMLKNKKIPYVSVKSDVGKRTIRLEGSSKISGAYVVEDVEIDNEIFRRLFYLSSQLVIQSEAKLKTVNTKKGSKLIVDLTLLTCQHHIYMSIAAKWACRQKKSSTVMVVGLGGGGLCSFLHKFLPQTTIMAVDIDAEMVKVATDWFGLRQNERLQVTVQDGLQHLKDLAGKIRKMDAILFDVDGKDSSIGMSCPPRQFLEGAVLDHVIKIIGQSGCFILNLVLREANLRPAIMSSLTSKFETVVSYRLAVDLNEILFCSPKKLDHEFVKQSMTECVREINKFFKQNHCKDNIEVDEYLNSLKML